MNGTKLILFGILLTLFGGFILDDPASGLPMGLDFALMVFGLLLGLYGVVSPEHEDALPASPVESKR